jgi:hypothetical protein
MDQFIGNNDQDDSTNQRGSNPKPPTIDPCSWKDIITNSSQDKCHYKQDKWPSRIMAGATIFIAFITFFYMFRLDQRAWIGITGISGKLEVGKPTVITIYFKNTGKTPAKKTTVAIVGETLDEKASPNFAHEQTVVKESRGLSTPQQDFVVSVNMTEGPLSDVAFKDVISGKVRVYVHGIVEYKDIFGRDHWITYCAYLSKDLRYLAYKEHNDTDDNY